jgi:ribonucleoside-triphosphate reductase
MNMAKLGYENKNETAFFENLERKMELAKKSLEIKRKETEKNLQNYLLPYSKRYLGTFNNHFSTIGLNGMNEGCENFLGENIASAEGKDFAIRTLEFMREKLQEFQKETNHMYNLEATPGEGTSYRLAKIDKKLHPKIITSGKENPYYTNSTHLPVNYTSDIFDALIHQDPLQVKYTCRTV